MSVSFLPSSDGASAQSGRHLFRQVQVEGLSFFPDQQHLRLHCRIQLGKRIVNAGLQTDYQLLDRWLGKLPNAARLMISEAVSEALIAGGRRWNFIDLRARMDERCVLRRCLIEMKPDTNANPDHTSLNIKAISV